MNDKIIRMASVTLGSPICKLFLDEHINNFNKLRVYNIDHSFVSLSYKYAKYCQKQMQNIAKIRTYITFKQIFRTEPFIIQQNTFKIVETWNLAPSK